MAYYRQTHVCPRRPPPLPDNSLRLYHAGVTGFRHRVLLVIDAKRAPYELCQVDRQNVPQWFRKRNPSLIFPVLEIPTEDGSKYLLGSVVICEYLDEMFPLNPLHSSCPSVKAQDRMLIETFNQLIKGSYECFRTDFKCGSKQIIDTLDILELELRVRGTRYFHCDSHPGMLDYMIWPWIERLYPIQRLNKEKFDKQRRRCPYIAQWGEQMKLDEVVKKHATSPY